MQQWDVHRSCWMTALELYLRAHVQIGPALIEQRLRFLRRYPLHGGPNLTETELELNCRIAFVVEDQLCIKGVEGDVGRALPPPPAAQRRRARPGPLPPRSHSRAPRRRRQPATRPRASAYCPHP